VGRGSGASRSCGALRTSGCCGTPRAAWGSEQVVLPTLSVTPPLTEWGVKEVAIDALHHLVYAGATSVAYSLLDR
jgi:hypothetical protein